jgi:translation initiation factor 5A
MEERPTPIKELKPGSYVMCEGEPCKVVSITISKPGKHGSTKARIEVMGIFDNRRRYILKPAGEDLLSPVIEKRNGQIISMTGDTVQVMDMQEYNTFETAIPEEFKGKIEAGSNILYWKLGSKIIIKEVRSD